MARSEKPIRGPVEIRLYSRVVSFAAVGVTDHGDVDITIDAMDLRTAKREVTEWLTALGYRSPGRWVTADEGWVRRFRP